MLFYGEILWKLWKNWVFFLLVVGIFLNFVPVEQWQNFDRFLIKKVSPFSWVIETKDYNKVELQEAFLYLKQHYTCHHWVLISSSDGFHYYAEVFAK